MIDGIERIPLQVFSDERGWFCELRRDSALPKAMAQTNLSFSRAGVVRGLHFHERGQDDLFACLQGTARVVVLDRETGETFTEDIGEENRVAIYIP
ncbi:MAG TPA: dTDP-4-dehydrorhamnose 3,5-epimerase family protein, partial [Gaiellaceae bacterium]